jgi:C-terminal processing protease CtpA/Prc
VKLIGEETGGGWHGNSGLMIPDITLPVTKLKVRLPLFKLVQYNHTPKNGKGVAPDIYVPPTVEAVRKNIDRKMEYVKQLINAQANEVTPQPTL